MSSVRYSANSLSLVNQFDFQAWMIPTRSPPGWTFWPISSCLLVVVRGLVVGLGGSVVLRRRLVGSGSAAASGSALRLGLGGSASAARPRRPAPRSAAGCLGAAASAFGLRVRFGLAAGVSSTACLLDDGGLLGDGLLDRGVLALRARARARGAA